LAGPVYEFGDFRLDCDRFELFHDGHSLRLERKPMELLILLASSSGRLVTRTEIASRLWDQEVFVDTEHGINTAIRKIRTALDDDPESPRFIQTVTGMGYRFVAQVAAQNGHPPQPAALLPPVAEPSNALVAQQPAASHRKRWIALGVAVSTAALALILTVGPNPLAAHLLHRNAQPAITSIAVLPLDNLSGDANQNYFADGMTDELTTMLARNSTLHVTSRTSAMQYKGAHRPLRDIAHELGVGGIVEGSVERSGDRLHMTLQLIRADTDTHLWAESYDRSAKDVGALPSEAAQAIAACLHSAVSVAQKPRYVNPAAHDAYLHGRYLWYGGWEQNEKAGEYFKKAIELQPDYALAWAGLATYYGQGAIKGDFNPNDSLALCESAAAKAVTLDDALPEAHLAMSAAVFMHRWDWNWAQREVNRALELNPRFAEAYHLDAMELSVLNRHAEAIEAEKKAGELEPSSHLLGMLRRLMDARQYDAALEDVRQRLEANPRDPSLFYMMMDIYRRKGMYKDAVAAAIKLNEVTNNQKEIAELQQTYNRGGYKAIVRRQLNERQNQSRKGYVSPMESAVLYAQLGDRERTISLLEEGFREHSPYLLWIQIEPAYDFLHSDPRYRSIIQRIGLPPAF
jgi:TolB-like protein/DNA-binding winged helix-turn-helix (wHTH) protein